MSKLIDDTMIVAELTKLVFFSEKLWTFSDKKKKHYCALFTFVIARYFLSQ
jgi:putative flippase GtrA